MEYTTLGRTGLRVSKMGLGCGGHSRLGQSHGATVEQAAEIVREALSLGINFIDTAEAYGTEPAVGLGIAGTARDRLVLSTKVGVRNDDGYVSALEMRARLEACLTRLGVEYVDIFHLHGVRPEHYAYARDEIVPALLRFRQEGKLRFLGITEQFANDTAHEMLDSALNDDVWDVVMVGFNLLNPSAREMIFARTQQSGVGVLDMFAVRRALSNPSALQALVQSLVERGEVDASKVDLQDPLGFLCEPGVADSITKAAYRFCRWEPGIDVVLSGTGNVEHLRENARSLSEPPLPPKVLARLEDIFGDVRSASGN